MSEYTPSKVELESVYDRELGWCFLPKWGPITTGEDVEFTRRLLEAAPKLLASCKALLARCEVLDEVDCSNRELAQAREAITAAEWESA